MGTRFSGGVWLSVPSSCSTTAHRPEFIRPCGLVMVLRYQPSRWGLRSLATVFRTRSSKWNLVGSPLTPPPPLPARSGHNTPGHTGYHGNLHASNPSSKRNASVQPCLPHPAAARSPPQERRYGRVDRVFVALARCSNFGRYCVCIYRVSLPVVPGSISYSLI
jgi:hypothetical protein